MRCIVGEKNKHNLFSSILIHSILFYSILFYSIIFYLQWSTRPALTGWSVVEAVWRPSGIQVPGVANVTNTEIL
jgi:hypothetical protein